MSLKNERRLISKLVAYSEDGNFIEVESTFDRATGQYCLSVSPNGIVLNGLFMQFEFLADLMLVRNDFECNVDQALLMFESLV